MADKEKRLRKILFHANLRGKLKMVKTLEEAYIVIVQHPHGPHNCFVYHKNRYQEELNKGETFPEEHVYFTVPTNPRNIRQITNSIVFKDRLHEK